MTESTNASRAEAPIRVGVISADSTLWRKIELALLGIAEVTRATYGSENEFDIVLLDQRSRFSGDYTEARASSSAEKYDGRETGERVGSEEAAHDSRTMRIIDRDEWHMGERALPYPFAFRELRELVTDKGASSARLIIEDDGRHILFDGKKIRLTEREHALLRAIAAGCGEFVGRDELRARAFGPDADGGILNVYIHYLREKLEQGGEKVILSSRLGGYRIDEKYLGVKK